MDQQAAANAALAAQARLMRLGPQPTYGPGQNIWALEGIDGLSSCCMAGNVGCCDMAIRYATEVEDEGMSGCGGTGCGCAGTGCGCSGLGCSGMSGFADDLLAAVKAALSVIPGASYAGLTPENVQMVYDIFTGAAADDFKNRVNKYNSRVASLNAALQKINTMQDEDQREALRKQHASVATMQASYGKELIAQINRYNELAQKASSYSLGFAKPEQVSTYSLSQISVPTLSGLGALGAIQMIPIAVIAGAIAIFWVASASIISTYCNYQLRLRGIDPGLDERYSGFMGSINRITDAAGDVFKFALIGGAVVLGWMIWKKKWIFAPKQAPVAIEVKTSPAVPQVLPEPKTAEPVPQIPQTVAPVTVAANPRRRRRRK